MAKAAGEVTGMGEVAARFDEIEGLQAEVRTHLLAIQDLYSRISRAAGGSGARRPGRPPGRPGRPPGRPAGTASAGGAKKRAPRGALREALQKVLAGGKTMGPAEIVEALGKAGFQTASEPKVFYNTVYLALKNNKGIEKTEDGFRLKAGAGKK